MTDLEAYDKLLVLLMKIPEEEVRGPDKLVSQAIFDGEALAELAREDREKLMSVGMDAEKIVEFDLALGARRVSESRLVQAWLRSEQRGYELREEMLAALGFAFRKCPDLVKSVRALRQGTNDVLMIQQLKTLAELARKHISKLQSINFDFELIPECEKTADLLGNLYPYAVVSSGVAEAKKIRDRAFTRMYSLMVDIRETAEYALRKDQERLRKYDTHCKPIPVGQDDRRRDSVIGNRTRVVQAWIQ